MGNEQSSPARNSRSNSRSTKSVACTPSPSPSPSRRVSPTRRPGRTARDPFADGDEPPPPYTKSSPTEKYLSPDSAFLSAQLPSTSDLRRSSSTSGSPRTPLAASSQSNTHRRHQSMANPRLHSSAMPGAGGSPRVDLRAIEQDLLVLQEALASRRTPSPRPGLFISRTPSPLPLGSNNPYIARATHTVMLSVPDRRSAAARAPTSGEDPLILLKRYDTQVIIDDSESMLGDHWYEACDALAKLVDAATKYEISGIRLHFLNSPHTCLVKSATDVRRAFQTVTPQVRSASPVGEKLEQLLLEYMAVLEASKVQGSGAEPPKPVNYIVLTDGAPSDDPESVIVATARRLDSQHFPLGQIGIQFVQIGNDREAATALRELDDELAKTHGVRDMVDTTPYTGGALTADILAKILLGGVNRRVDKRSL